MNGFVAENIPDESAERLVCAILTDAVYRYSRALLHSKEYVNAATKREKRIYENALFTINEVESFFRGKWFASLADYMNLNISGEQIIKMIKKTPKRFANKTGRRKANYVAN